MKPLFSTLLFVTLSFTLQAQVSTQYKISFENAIHHEAKIEAHFKKLKSDTATFRMSRTSPGRYALHEFAKNVYSVKVTDGLGNTLETFRTDPYSWHVAGHTGEIKLSYTLFANHGDGTYAQIDETHAHLNIPATFMFMDGLENDEIEIQFMPREDLNWQISTQLKKLEGNKYYAKDLQYFMDNPTELSDHRINTFKIGKGVNAQTIEIALHDLSATDEQFAEYTKHLESIVREQQAVYGELPKFDYGKYTFLACFMPQVNGDAMEHRNSTYLTTTRSLNDDGVLANLGSASHEFFHCWNVERIRPKSLEPFDFTEVNMSGALWFAEGFTNYYTDLAMIRAGVRTKDQYLNGLKSAMNYVWTSNGTSYFNPIEMSYQAPFVDAARSVDDTNRGNTFISYYTYGEVLGLALDLMLREQNLSLDGYMKSIWNKFGKSQTPYDIRDLHQALSSYSNAEFADNYFNNYIYNSKMPEYKKLFESVGIQFDAIEEIGIGANMRNNEITNYPTKGSSAYATEIQKGDKILSIEGVEVASNKTITEVLATKQIGDSVSLTIERYGKEMAKTMVLKPQKKYNLNWIEDDKLDDSIKKNRERWLSSKAFE